MDGSPVWRNPLLIIAVELGERERGERRGKMREGGFLTDTQKKKCMANFLQVSGEAAKRSNSAGECERKADSTEQTSDGGE